MSEFTNYLSMEKELQEKYPYKIVAIYKGKVVASGNTYKEVLDKAYKKIGKVKMMIHQVGSLEDSVSIL